MTGAELMEQFIPNSPFAAGIGVRLERIEPDHATLALPWSEGLATIGDIVHGGAIATLADCAVMAAAWSAVDAGGSLRGVTVSLTLNYLETARAEALVAHGRVVRRGRSLCTCEVDIEGADGRLVAKGLATYKVG
jgi:uncharacterized protein (TIGR00369 family)